MKNKRNKRKTANKKLYTFIKKRKKRRTNNLIKNIKNQSSKIFLNKDIGKDISKIKKNYKLVLGVFFIYIFLIIPK